MKIKALQKITLIDYPEKIACTLFIYGCNFKCSFCHNPELVIEKFRDGISKEEIFEFLEKRKGKLEGVCITGGEPLFSLEKEFVREIKKKGYLVKIDTNGSFPERLKEFIEEKLVDFVSMDIKGIKEDYEFITNCKISLEDIEKSIKLVSNLENYEFRTTILEDIHTAEKMKKLGKWIFEITKKKPKKFVLQGFKNSGKMIDGSFGEKGDTSESYLTELKKVVGYFFESVDVRV